jgi:hypothetical protein
MLERAPASESEYLQQLARAQASTWRCPCGCASFNLLIPDLPPPEGPLEVLADFVFGSESTLAGAFVFARNGILSGVEIYGLAGDAPAELPLPSALRPFASAAE